MDKVVAIVVVKQKLFLLLLKDCFTTIVVKRRT
jgi:hypothetical protein